MEPTDPKSFYESRNERNPPDTPPTAEGNTPPSTKRGPLATTMKITFGTQCFFWLAQAILNQFATNNETMAMFAAASVPLLFVGFLIIGIGTWDQKNIGKQWVLGAFVSLVLGFGTCAMGELVNYNVNAR